MTKKRAVTYTLFAFSAFLIYSHGLCWAISITPKPLGSWSKTIGSSDLTAGAGSDLNPTYESSSDVVVINISDTTVSWAVTVKKADTTPPTWDNLHLYIRRTSEGSCGTLSGGNNYQELTDIDTPFFSGSNVCSNISVQLKLELTGVPKIVPPGDYITTIYYTVTE